jgi:hypothetical protein
LLAYVRRDDLEGKGTISEDPLDRAFGLSGLLANMKRAFDHDLVGVINMVLAMYEAHFQEQEKRYKIMPAEWKQLQAEGKARHWQIQTSQGALRVAQAITDNPSLAGFLRAYHNFDVVVLRLSSGHVNILTNQSKKISMAPVIAQIRKVELQKTNPQAPLPQDLGKQGRIDELPHWYYDTMANTLQNGGTNPENTQPTALTDDEIANAIVQALFVSHPTAPPPGTS